MKTKVLIIADSAIIRSMYTKIFNRDPGLEVVGAAPDPYVAREMIALNEPDVITLDIEMPRMDGLQFLEAMMKHHPIRTLVISSLTQRNSELALRAIELGAIDVIAKPIIDVSKSIEKISAELIDRVKTVARARLPNRREGYAKTSGPKPAVISKALSKTTHQVLAIAASTGGTEALKQILPFMPADLPGTVIVQHMPAVFTKTYSMSLQKLCPHIEVREAQEGDRIQPGRVLLAPGNFHMEIKRDGAYYHVRLNQDAHKHGVRPAADPMFLSLAQSAGKNAIGVILTGMGRDGAKGLLEMKNAGAFNIAQDEKSCVVFGMPKEAVEIGAINKVMPLNQIAGELLEQFQARDIIRSA